MAKSRSEKIRQEEEKLKRECKTRKCTVLLLRLRHQDIQSLEEKFLMSRLFAKYGIRDCYVNLNRVDEIEQPSNREKIPRRLVMYAGSVHDHCKWIPTKKSVQQSA